MSALFDPLRSYLESGRLPHALLLIGSCFTQIQKIAREFSHELLCEHREKRQPACGNCQSCVLFQAGSHWDYEVIEPIEKNHAIKIDQIRSIQGRIEKKALMGEYQVIVIQPAEALNRQASNALLKMLEEPSDGTLFLLVSKNANLILPTLVSRCQIVRFSSLIEEKEPSKEEITNDLKSLLVGQCDPITISKKWASLEVGEVLYCIMDYLNMIAMTHQQKNPEKFWSLWDQTVSFKREIEKTVSEAGIVLDVLALSFFQAREACF